MVVDDLASAIAFFVELGLELDGQASVEGRWVDGVVGLNGVQADIAVLQTPDGDGRLELSKFHAPAAVSAEPNAPANALGIRHILFAVDDLQDVLSRLQARGPNSSAQWSSTRTATGPAISAAPKVSSSSWPSSWADVPGGT